MSPDKLYFETFEIDTVNSQLMKDGVAVDLGVRYIEALTLLVREQGKLVTKQRFLAEVWKGVPVTEQALSQCIRSLRHVLSDDAANPRFIETVPKHGYRFIAPVRGSPCCETNVVTTSRPFDWHRYFLLSVAGIVGGTLAGLVGGICYGFIGAEQLPQHGGGGSIMLVLTALTVLIAILGAAGVSLGAAAAIERSLSWVGFIAGGALGGLLVGAVFKLMAIAALVLLFGRSPADVTGAFEGAVLGGLIGLGIWFGIQAERTRIWPAALCGLIAGIGITISGGRLLGGSLDRLAYIFPQSQLRLDPLGRILGEDRFGPNSAVATGGFEGMLFAVGVTAGMLWAARRLRKD